MRQYIRTSYSREPALNEYHYTTAATNAHPNLQQAGSSRTHGIGETNNRDI
jgi:hypothetical protein